MNWDMVKQLVEHKARSYALDGGKNMEGSDVYALRYNGFYNGYIENAAERESLRAILRIEEGKIKTNPPPIAPKVSTPIDDSRTKLDDLI